MKTRKTQPSPSIRYANDCHYFEAQLAHTLEAPELTWEATTHSWGNISIPCWREVGQVTDAVGFDDAADDFLVVLKPHKGELYTSVSAIATSYGIPETRLRHAMSRSKWVRKPKTLPNDATHLDNICRCDEPTQADLVRFSGTPVWQLKTFTEHLFSDLLNRRPYLDTLRDAYALENPYANVGTRRGANFSHGKTSDSRHAR